MGRGTRDTQSATAAVSNHVLRRRLQRIHPGRPAWVDGADRHSVAVGRQQVAAIEARAYAPEVPYGPWDLAITLHGPTYRGRLIWRPRTLRDPTTPGADTSTQRRLALMACTLTHQPLIGEPPGPPRLCVIERERNGDADWTTLSVLADTDYDLDAMLAVMNARAAELIAAGIRESDTQEPGPWDAFDDASTNATRAKVDEGLRRIALGLQRD